jgi:hypothetical protein
MSAPMMAITTNSLIRVKPRRPLQAAFAQDMAKSSTRRLAAASMSIEHYFEEPKLTWCINNIVRLILFSVLASNRETKASKTGSEEVHDRIRRPYPRRDHGAHQ